MDEAEDNLRPNGENKLSPAGLSQMAKVTSFFSGVASRMRPSRQNDGASVPAGRVPDTAEKAAESALSYRELLDAQACLIVRRDAKGRIIFANRSYLAAFGLSESDPASRSLAPRVLAQEIRGLDLRTVELVETVKGPRWIEWEENERLAPGGVLETQRLGRDITEERQSADELRQARDEAIAANHAKSRFLAIMSHEIRTPMNGILGMTDLLLEGPLTPEQENHARIIAQSARALMSLIDEILDFSRIEAGKLELTEAPFSIAETIEGCVALMEPRAAAKSIDLISNVEGEMPPLLCGDESRVRQILLNLLSNAIKFTDQGHVSVTLRADAAEADSGPVRVRLSVADTGIGLTYDECDAVFGEFERADSAVRRHEGGTGLGLAIARRIANAMQGDITVESEPGRGSTFHADLVLDRASPNAAALREALDRSAAAEKSMAGAPVPSHASRVLLVEDNAVNALLATRLLEREGCVVFRARTGDEAVAAVTRSFSGLEKPFDLILMDIYMPRLDGIDATRAIRRAAASSKSDLVHLPPIVAVTANAFEEDRQRYLAAGMDDYLAKPFDASALRAVLKRWISAKEKLPAA